MRGGRFVTHCFRFGLDLRHCGIGLAFLIDFAEIHLQLRQRGMTCEDGRMRSFRAHGLRKAALTHAAHAECTGPELMALSVGRTKTKRAEGRNSIGHWPRSSNPAPPLATVKMLGPPS